MMNDVARVAQLDTTLPAISLFSQNSHPNSEDVDNNSIDQRQVDEHPFLHIDQTQEDSSTSNEQPLIFRSLSLDLLHTTLSLIPISERQTLLQISSRFTSIVTHPSFLLSRMSNGVADEVLFLVGGTYPSRTTNRNGRIHRGGGGGGSASVSSSSFSVFNPNQGARSLMGHRDTFSRGLWGYVPSLKSWRMFGGDPCRELNHPMQHVVDSKAVYVPHPHYELVLLGGYKHIVGEEVDRVVSYSLLTGQWRTWPSMLRARRGTDLHVQFVPPNKIVVIGCSHGKCGCSRCAGGTLYHDAMDMDWSAASTLASRATKVKAAASASAASGSNGRCSNSLQSTFFDYDEIMQDGKIMGSGRGAVFDGHAEVYDIFNKSWARKEARAPSCPPRDGGAAVLEDRYIYLPGVEKVTAAPSATARKNAMSDSTDSSSRTSIASTVITPTLHVADSASGSDAEYQVEACSIGSRSSFGSPIARSPPSTPPLAYSRCSSPALPGPAPNSRPGLIYDVQEDIWTTLEPCRSPSTRFPTTIAHGDKLLIMGGYRSGRCGDSIMSLFRDGLIVDYEEHMDNCWTYSRANGKWSHGHDCAGASTSCDEAAFPLPKSIPVPTRGASALIYNGRLTLLGGMTTFNQTTDNEERRIIWQYYGEEDHDDDDCSCSSTASKNSTASSIESNDPRFSGAVATSAASAKGWKPLFLDWEFGKATQVKLPVSALLDTYTFSAQL